MESNKKKRIKYAIAKWLFFIPDLIIIEQFYKYASCKIIRELQGGNHKYIIVPRGELTEAAQMQSSLKKRIMNILLFNSFAKKACAIQYLTEKEKGLNSERWNKHSTVIPNGTLMPEEFNKNYSTKGLHFTFIGRLAPYHKGIDILFDACYSIKKELIDANCFFSLYGPDEENVSDSLNRDLKNRGLNEFVKLENPVKGKEKEKVLKQTDIFIMTSRFEGLPTGLLEALSYRLPCLVTEGTNMKREVELYNAGWTAENNANSVAEALLDILQNRNNLENYGLNAYKLALEYSWDSIARKSHGEYVGIVNKFS